MKKRDSTLPDSTYLLHILRGARFDRLRQYASDCARRSGKSELYILADMVLCFLLFGATYSDYRIFGFDHIARRERRRFLTRVRMKALVEKANGHQPDTIVDDKLLFARRFPDVMRRELVSLDAPDAEVLEFLNRHSDIMVKPKCGTCGTGISRFSVSADNARLCLAQLRAAYAPESTILEPYVIQHPELASLNPDSVNTLRFVYIGSQLLYVTLRVGRRGQIVDNQFQGGLSCQIDPETGEILSDAVDKQGTIHSEHPDYPGVHFAGGQVPFIAQARRQCLSIMKDLSQKYHLNYIGFDVAIQSDGPLIIEANAYPTQHLGQLPGFRYADGHQGLWPTVKRYLEVLYGTDS